MFTSIVARTFRLARHAWARTVLANLVASVLAASVIAALLLLGRVLLGDTLKALTDDSFSGADSGRLLVFGVPIALLVLVTYGWVQLVPIRAISGKLDIRASLTGAVEGAWHVLPLYLIVGAIQLTTFAIDTSGVLLLLVTIVLSVPTMAAVGQMALEPGRWGLALLWRRGILRVHRNVGAYLAVGVVLLLNVAIAAALFLLPVLLLAGPPPTDALRDASELQSWLDGATLGVVLGAVLAYIPALTLPAALIVAIHDGLTGALDHARWADDDEPFVPRSELSAAVQQLVGTSQHTARKFVVPPQADQPGRVPGPGVLNVAGVDLPAGRATRSVEAATLELAVGDGSPGATNHDEQLWISRDALPDTPVLWRRLAAAFSETGLWPIAIPVAGTGGSIDWFEHATRRDADALAAEDAADVASRMQLRLTESLDGGSPLASTDLLRASRVARGELMRGQGRRTDALSFTFTEIGPARLALAPARRPGDVLHALAWPGASAAGVPTDELALLVSSWEERYAALLVGLGEASIVFAVLRPPSTLEEAVEVVAEHHALCPDEALAWGDDRSAAEQLVNAPTWRLSWH